MNDDFSRIITMLRKERNISQRDAAQALEVSQAVLSHYECGRRNCTIEFVLKVADYYDVSCDYLLGRSAIKSGAQLTIEDIPEPDAVRDNAGSKMVKGSVVATLNKKLISNSLNILFDGLIKIGENKLTTEVSHYIVLAVYNMFRSVYGINPQNPQQLFSVPKHFYKGYAGAAMHIIESNVDAYISGRDPETGEKRDRLSGPEMSVEAISKDYPLFATSLMNVIQYAEGRMQFN